MRSSKSQGWNTVSAFDRFAPFIQDYIYAHDWESLRGIQVAAADAVFNTDCNVLLTASTAWVNRGGLFPILTEFYENPLLSIRALYIAPLKALINDQFARFSRLASKLIYLYGDGMVMYQPPKRPD